MRDATTAEHPFTPEDDVRISAHVRARGLTFTVFLPEGIADWLWQKLEAGVYKDPAEAAFLAFQDLMELDHHPAVRAQLLKVMVNAAADDPRPGMTIEEWRTKHQATLREYASTEPPAPRTWSRDFSREQIEAWIADDEQGLQRFESGGEADR
jgi:antitoxin ParD1/3/4